LTDRTLSDTIKRFYIPQAMWRALRHATRLIVTTNAMADTIVRRCPEAQARIVVIPMAAGPMFVPPSNREIARTKGTEIIGTDAPFFLVVGQNNRRKQHRVALAAFARGAPDSWRLVLLQGKDSGRGLRKLAERLRIADRVVWLGAVEIDALIALYQSAHALIQPSLCEAFGQPIVEAMACGCPVIASDLPTLREVMGDAGIFISQNDVAGFARAVHQLARSEDEHTALSDAGRERAAIFSWDRCARQTLETYRMTVDMC
jgi:glycosyltransferase involved in cell wall biosynthesis